MLWLASVWMLRGRQLLAPALSYIALVVLSLARVGGVRVLPVNTTILTAWLCITLVVMVATLLQPEALRRQTRATEFFAGGAAAGLAVGMLGLTATMQVSALYAWMIVGTAAGTALGFLLYTSTPAGRAVRPGSGHFLRLLLAKGFPTAVTFMMIGVALVLWGAMSNVDAI